MRVHDSVVSLVRRWYIVLSGLVLTLILCWVIQERVPVIYEAKGSQVLMPPPATVKEGNPYLYLGGMNQALDVLIRQVTAAEAVGQVLESFPDSAYTVEVDGSTTGAILVTSASGPTPNDTLGVLDAALKKIPAVLNEMQSDLAIPDAVRISVRTVVVERQTTKNDEAQMRLTLLGAGAGTVGTIFVTALLDSFLIRARSSSHPADESPAVPEAGDTDVDDHHPPSSGAVTAVPGMPEGRASR